MSALITPDEWQSARAAVRGAAARFADLVRAADPAAMATADWSVGDTAAHVVLIAWLDNALLGADDPPLPVPGVLEAIPETTVDTVDRLNEMCLRHFTERDHERLAEQLRAQVDRLLETSADLDPDQVVDWLGGARLPVGGLLAHLANELLIHGRDIARATGAPWEMPPRDSALFFDLFLIGMVRNGLGRIQERERPPPDRRVSVELRSPYTTPAVLVTQGREVSLDESGGGADVYVLYDPVTLVLMLFGRISRVRAVLSGKVTVRGRRRLLLTFLKAVRFPS